MAEQRSILLKLEVDKEKAQQNLESNAAQIEINRKELQKLNKQYKDGSITVQQYSKSKLQLNNANKELGAENRKLIKQLDTEDNSLNALRQSLSKLTEERNNINQQTDKGAERFKEKQKQILETTNAIKEQEEAGGDYRRSVGNYQRALEGAEGALDNLTNGLLTSAKALLANPIGIIVASLTTLIALFKRSQQGIDLFERGFAAINAVINTVADNLGKLASIVGAVVSGNLIKATQLTREFTSELSNNVKQTDALTIAQQKLNRSIIANQSLNVKSLAVEEELKNIRDNELNSLEDRVAANEKLFVIEEKRFQRNIKDAEEQLRIAKELNKIRGGVDETLQAVADAETRLFELREEKAGRENEFITNRTGLIREASEDQIALIEARIQKELVLVEEGSRTELELRLRLLKERQALELQAVGENITRRKEIIVRGLAEELQLYKDFQENISTINKIRNNEEVTGVKIVSREIKAIDTQTTQDRIANIEAELEAERLKNQITLDSTAALSGTLAGLFEKNTIAYKTFASIDAAISTYTAINKTLASLPFPANVISSVGIGIQGFANVAKINGLIGGGGGAGGAGATTSQPRISRSTLDGAFDRNRLTSDTNNQANQTQQITDTLKNQPAPIVKVSDINKVQNRKGSVTVSGSL